MSCNVATTITINEHTVFVQTEELCADLCLLLTVASGVVDKRVINVCVCVCARARARARAVYYMCRVSYCYVPVPRVRALSVDRRRLSVCRYICPVPDPKSRIERPSKLKNCKNEAHDTDYPI